MPIFEFKCADCDNKFEELFTAGGSDNGIACPACESTNVTKLFSTYAPQMGSSASNAPAMPACAGGCPNAGSCGMM
jgi:putative FmdB family regulatory protein